MKFQPTMSLIAMMSSGSDKIKLNQNRRCISSSSVVSSTALASRGSRAMPHLGQLPGPIFWTSGSIGQV